MSKRKSQSSIVQFLNSRHPQDASEVYNNVQATQKLFGEPTPPDLVFVPHVNSHERRLRPELRRQLPLRPVSCSRVRRGHLH